MDKFSLNDLGTSHSIQRHECNEVFLYTPKRFHDDRGESVKLLNFDELKEATNTFSQVLLTNNQKAGTVRGMHFQVGQNADSKFIWCNSGLLFDVFVDLRSTEPTYGRWFSIELDSVTRSVLYLPKGIAHGYQTLQENTSITYLIDASYDPNSERTLYYADSMIGIEWPLPVSCISEKDKNGLRWPIKF